MLRIFIAAPVSREASQELIRIRDELRRRNPHAPIRWVGDSNFHITLAFLGEVADERIRTVKTIIAQITAQFPAVPLRLELLDAFPNRIAPRVIIVKAAEQIPSPSKERAKGEVRPCGSALTQLQHTLALSLTRAGFPLDQKPWIPHFTIGRVKAPVQIKGLDLMAYPVQWKVKTVELIESKLTPHGSQYSTVGEWRLTQ